MTSKIKTKKPTWVAVVVAGDANMTRVTHPRVLSEPTLDSFAASVQKKQPNRLYYIYEFNEAGTRKKGDPLYVWHVGAGFSHANGWWTDTDF